VLSQSSWSPDRAPTDDDVDHRRRTTDDRDTVTIRTAHSIVCREDDLYPSRGRGGGGSLYMLQQPAVGQWEWRYGQVHVTNFSNL